MKIIILRMIYIVMILLGLCGINPLVDRFRQVNKSVPRIDISENGKNMPINQEDVGFIADNVIYYIIHWCSI